MPDRRPLVRRTVALALLAATAACGRSDRGRADSAGGEVAGGPRWSAPTLTAIRGVPVAEVKAAIDRRLGEAAPAGLRADQWRHVRTLYGRFGKTPLWFDADGLDQSRATAFLRAVVDADRDALRLDNLSLPLLATALQPVTGGARPTPEQLADADVAMSAAFAALGESLLNGQVDPRAVSQDWHIPADEGGIDSALVRSLSEPQIDRAIARMRPQTPDYEALRTALVRYRDLATKGGWPAVPAGRPLKPGESDRAERLQALRARLAAEGFDVGATQANARATASAVPAPNAVGGGDSARRARPAQVRPPRPGEATYDAALAGAVAAYQARHAIVVDSVLGVETVQSMNVAPAYRRDQLAANLERMRWMPRDLGARYLVVNVPAFHLQAFENRKPALDMKVVVGKSYEDRKTAVFADTMTTVVFRPYWNLTDDIMDKEVWPKVQADPGYLAAHRMETFEEGGRTRLRQLPGDENSLGLVKFLFPNDFNIYLHDTPEKGLFDKDVRAFSHGCIRLEKPAQLAQWVLGWDAARVQEAMERGPDNQSVKVTNRLPVYITYYTAYLEDGQLHFGNDLYDRDAALVRTMTAGGGQQPATVQAVQQLRQLVAR